jgi:predicted  nucleic acid-binding Zn ribbon protein
MYNYKIKFVDKPEADKVERDILYDAVFWYMLALSNNGQVITGFNIFFNDDYYYASVILPEKDSLSDSNNGYYVKQSLEKLNEYFNIEIIYDGNNAEHDTVCKCEKPSWYLLYTNRESHDYPLLCGDCESPVPLYKIPYLFKDKEHNTILHWSHAYESMLGVWISGLDDRYTYKQLNAHNSTLNRDGQTICRELKKKLGVPVYYYLFYFDYFDDVPRSPKGAKEAPKLCPKCGFDWTCPNEQNPIHYKCDRCLLLADNPGWEQEK